MADEQESLTWQTNIAEQNIRGVQIGFVSDLQTDQFITQNSFANLCDSHTQITRIVQRNTYSRANLSPHGCLEHMPEILPRYQRTFTSFETFPSV